MSLARHILVLDDAEAEGLPLAEIEPRAGETIAELLRRADWPTDLTPTVVRSGELYYGREEWSQTLVPANMEVLSRPGRGGTGGAGGSGAIGAAVAMIALSVLAPWAAGAVFGAGLLGKIAAAAIVAGGGLLLSHFLKPKTAKTAPATPLYNFNLSGNAARPLQMVPVGYGRRLVSPDFATPSYSEFDGDAMTSYAVYALGCGEYDVEEIRLGDTTIWTALGGPTGVGAGMTFQVVQPGEDVTLFPINVVSSTEVTGQQLNDAWTAGGWVGPYAVNPATTQAKQILIDLVLPQGAYVTYKENTYPAVVGIRVEYRPINDAGTPLAGYSVLFENSFVWLRKSTIRLTLHLPVTPGRYEVRVGRATEPLSEALAGNAKLSGNDDVVVSALRAHIEGPSNFPGVTTIAVKATADAGLQSVNSGSLRVLATRKLPTWNGTTWSAPVATRSIAWAAADIWRNADYSAGLPDRGLDLATFLAFHSFWTGEDHTFDHWFTEPSSVVEAMETVLKAGRAMPDIVGDTVSIVRDEEQPLPALLFTDHSIIRGSVSLDYNLPDQQVADGIIGQYLDETTWRLAEVSSAPDGVTLAKPARVELTGVTKRAQAAGLVRFMQAENQYRRVGVEFQIEAEGQLIKRGMSIAVQTEEPQSWGFSGEVEAYDPLTRTLTLDPPPVSESAATYWIELRCRDGVYFGPMRVTFGAGQQYVIINSSDLTAVQSAVGRTIAAALTRGDGEDRPAYVFSAGQPRSYRLLVKEGSTSGGAMRLTCVNDDVRVYDVVETGVPALPTVPAFLNPEAAPSLSQLSAIMRQEGAAAMLVASWKPNGAARRYVAQIRYAADEPWQKVYDGDQPSLKIQVSPQDLTIRVAALNAKNIPGSWIQQDVDGIDVILSSDRVWLEVDIDSFRPSSLDRVVMEPIFADSQAELAAFTDRVVATRQWEARDKESHALVKESVALYADATQAIAGLQTVVFARLGTAEASITQNALAISSATKSIATLSSTLTATIEDTVAPLTATVEANSTAIADIGGQIYGQWAVKIETQTQTGGGTFKKVSGFGLIQEGGGGEVISEFNVAVDRFNILPAVSTGTATSKKPVFTVGTVGGVATVGIHGDLYLDGTIAAAKLVVSELSAITANIGTVTAGLIKSPDDKMQINLTGGYILISDA